LSPLAAVVLFAVFAFLFAVAGFFTAWLLRRDIPTPLKNIPYECGEETVGRTWIQFHVGYYVIALIFVIFDVEAVFLVPWAVAFKALGLVGFIEMAIFIAILLLGLLWVWKKGALEWL
jgi:NADH-quinone oxidoreductase subunit A